MLTSPSLWRVAGLVTDARGMSGSDTEMSGTAPGGGA